ncbi:hypothetical protein DL770_009478 [Monosporascus sp. CRB-9-2]|nr:hypothetical protein DL770_009478 [Monosporascus sp. CRB-9-2]
MTVVAVAGGLGDLGRIITDALFETGKHEIQAVQDKSDRISPLTGKRYLPIIQTDYSSEDSLVEQLTEKHVNVVICAFIMDCDSASDAQLRLIRAADRCPCVQRFIPSEFNVEYNVGDNVLPYPEKRFHITARQELEKTSTLEYAYIYPGMFMDYFDLPRVISNLRPLCFFIDPANGQAVLPGDGEAKMSMTFTTDAARYIALALELDQWPRILTTAASTVSLNELVRLVEKSLGRKLEVQYQPVEKLLKHETVDLPTNVDIAKGYPQRFPQGLDQLRALVADLEAGVALGAFDFGKLNEHVNLVKVFEGKAPAPKRIEELIEEAWKAEFSQILVIPEMYTAVSLLRPAALMPGAALAAIILSTGFPEARYSGPTSQLGSPSIFGPFYHLQGNMSTAATNLQQVKASEGRDAILGALREDGAVIIKGLFTTDQRLNNVVSLSRTFRQEILENNLIRQLCEEIYLKDAGGYWMNSAQVIDIGPASKAQPLHRDQWQFPIFTYCGPNAPEASVNFVVALTEFTDENGATRVIPGSHKWDDFQENGTPEDTIPAEMQAGDACFISGKVVHGGGANRTKDFTRRGITLVFQCSYLTPEEAYPFLVEKEIAKTLSPRAQRMIGFRSQFLKDSPGVWKRDYGEVDEVYC